MSNKLNRSCFIIEVIEVDSDDVDDDDYDDDVNGGVLGIFGKQPNKKQPRHHYRQYNHSTTSNTTNNNTTIPITTTARFEDGGDGGSGGRKKPIRKCMVDGCNTPRVQNGRCVAHGAKVKKCSVAICNKHRQGPYHDNG